jgi:hypothetical protein
VGTLDVDYEARINGDTDLGPAEACPLGQVGEKRSNTVTVEIWAVYEGSIPIIGFLPRLQVNLGEIMVVDKDTVFSYQCCCDEEDSNSSDD